MSAKLDRVLELSGQVRLLETQLAEKKRELEALIGSGVQAPPLNGVTHPARLRYPLHANTAIGRARAWIQKRPPGPIMTAQLRAVFPSEKPGTINHVLSAIVRKNQLPGLKPVSTGMFHWEPPK